MFNSKRLIFLIVFLFSLTLVMGIFSGCSSQNPLGSEDSTIATLGSVDSALALAPPTKVSGEIKVGENKDKEPSYVSSVHIDGVVDLSTLPGLITQDQAIAAALAEVPGIVINAELENERGNIVYDVEIKALDGICYEVTVDAGNATILNTEVAGGGKGYGRDNNPGKGKGTRANPPIEDDPDDLDDPEI
jgi:hypothetical protein